MSGYYPAQICLNGHVISPYNNNVQPFCSECGAKTITTCPSCNTPIRGMYHSDVPSFGFDYDFPAYCFACGKPYPWTKAQLEAISELASIDEQLTDDEKTYISNNVSSLMVDTPRTKVVATKFSIFFKKAGHATVSAMRDILVDIASESAKKIIFPQ